MRGLAFLLLVACASEPAPVEAADAGERVCDAGVVGPLGTCAIPPEPLCDRPAFLCCTPNAIVEPFCQGGEAVCLRGTRRCTESGLIEREQCGDAFPVACGSGLHCAIRDGHCGRVMPGFCLPLVDSCGDDGIPTCTCDGRVYASSCDAARHGQTRSDEGTCPAVDGRFRCGALYCDQATMYCRRVPFSESDFSYGCGLRPQGCSACSCLAPLEPGCACEETASGLVVTCTNR